jgi:hypothetical protein
VGRLHAAVVGGCASIAVALSSGINLTAGDGNGEDLDFGMVPNGNATVAVTTQSGAVTTVPVVHNLYAVTTSAPVRTVALRNAEGAPATVTEGPGG